MPKLLSSPYFTYACLFALAVFMFYPAEFRVGHDLTSYLASAKSFLDGRGMLDIQGEVANHRFGYKLLLVLSLKLGTVFGNELLGVILMQSLFCSFTALMVFIFSKKLFDSFTALLAFALFVLCTSFTTMLPRMGLDGVWPGVLLLSLMLFLNKADNKLKTGTFCALIICSGIVAGLHIWIKETTGLNYLIVPILATFLLNMDNKILRLVLFYGAVILTTFIGKYIVVSYLGGEMGGDSSNEQRSFKSALEFSTQYYNQSNKVFSIILFILDGLRGYLFYAPFSSNPHKYFPIFALFYPALVFSFYQCYKNKDKSHLLLLIILASYFFYMSWAAQWGMRQSQLVIIYIVIGIIISSFIVAVVRLLNSQPDLKYKKTIIFVFVFGVLGFHHTSSKYKPFYLDDNPVVNRLKNITSAQHNLEPMHIGKDISAHINDALGERRYTIISNDIMDVSGVNYYLGGRVATSVDLYKRIMLGVHENPYIPYYKETDDVAFVCMRSGIRNKREGKRYTEIFNFVPSHLIDVVRRQNHDSFVLIRTSHDCSPLFENWIENDAKNYGISFEHVSIDSIEPKYNLYQVKVSNQSYSVGMSSPVDYSELFLKYMTKLYNRDSYAFNYYVSNYEHLNVASFLNE